MDALQLTHCPTTGAMYEGLTAEILARSIPAALGLRIATGFIASPAGSLSPQVDCMLVRGEGRSIPHTDNCIWPIQDVLAVLEVKKSLHGAEYMDAYAKLRAPVEQYLELLMSDAQHDATCLAPTCNVYARLTGTCAPTPDRIGELSYERKMILSTIALEQVSPVRIALGYDGFASEAAMRKSLKKFLKSRVGQHGYGIHSFPQLSLSGDYALLKLNGFPYQPLMNGGWWTFLASAQCRPLELMLEYIWTRIRRDFPQLGDVWGDDLELEVVHPCVSAIPFHQPGQSGWQMRTDDIGAEELLRSPTHYDWQPQFVSKQQFAAFALLCAEGVISILSEPMARFSREAGSTVEEFVAGLVATSLVARRDDSLELTTEECRCVILPDGRLAVADDNSGRLTRWIAKHFGGAGA